MIKKVKVLVIDDYPDSGSMLSLALENMGYEVVQLANNGMSAFSKIRKFIPDVVLCDICMPDMLGYEVCKKLKAYIRLAHTLFIAQTAIDSDAGKNKASDASFSHHLIKPLDVHELSKIITTHCKTRLLNAS